MAAIHSDEFKRDAVRIATTSGLTRRRVASDSLAGRRLPSIAVRLGGGLSILNKWGKMASDAAGPPDLDQNLLRENERLRRENRILKV